MDKLAFLDLDIQEEREWINFIVLRYFATSDVNESSSTKEKELLAEQKECLEMDLLFAHHIFKLRLEDFSNTGIMFFITEIIAIQNNIDRENVCFNEHFIPKFATQ